jgi:RNA polymerase sigma-70 factor (ECF subfamily)
MAAVCRRYSPSPEDTADLLQEGYIRVFDKLHQWQGGSLEGWMRRIFVTNCLNAFDKRKRRLSLIDPLNEVVENTVPANEDFYDFLAADVIQEAIDGLPEGARVIFNLFAVEGFPHTEIAVMLHITESACRSQLTRARKLLQQRLEPMKPPVSTQTLSSTL